MQFISVFIFLFLSYSSVTFGNDTQIFYRDLGFINYHLKSKYLLDSDDPKHLRLKMNTEIALFLASIPLEATTACPDMSFKRQYLVMQVTKDGNTSSILFKESESEIGHFEFQRSILSTSTGGSASLSSNESLLGIDALMKLTGFKLKMKVGAEIDDDSKLPFWERLDGGKAQVEVNGELMDYIKLNGSFENNSGGVSLKLLSDKKTQVAFLELEYLHGFDVGWDDGVKVKPQDPTFKVRSPQEFNKIGDVQVVILPVSQSVQGVISRKF